MSSSSEHVVSQQDHFYRAQQQQLIIALQNRLNNRKNGVRENPNIFRLLCDYFFLNKDIANKPSEKLTWFGDYTLAQKETAINKLIDELNNVRDVSYSDSDIGALRQGDTGDIIKAYAAVLPPKYQAAWKAWEIKERDNDSLDAKAWHNANKR